MKPDGVAMETAEPAEVAAASEPSSMQENVVEQVPSHLGAAAANSAPHEAPKTNGKPVTVDPKAKTKQSGSRPLPAASTGLSGSRPGTNSHRPVREVKPASPLAKKTATATTAAASKATAGVMPKKHAGMAAVSSTGRNPTRAPAGAARPSAPSVPANVNGTLGRKTAADSANGAKPRTAAAGRTLTSTAPKPGPSATTKPVGAAASKATRTAAGVSASRTSKLPATTAKPAAAVKTAVSKSAAAPPTGRTAAAPPPKAAAAAAAAAKKDVGRPPAALAAKKPAAATASPAAKKQEASKPAAASKASAVPKEVAAAAAKAVDNKSKPPPPAKVNAAKKPAAAGRLPAVKKPLPSQTPPVSPANKPAKSSITKTKGGAKPVQTVAPFSSTKRSRAPGATAAAAAAPPEAPSGSASTAEDEPAGTAAEPSPQEPPQTASTPEEAPTLQSATPASPTPEQNAPAATAPPPDKAPPMSSCPHPMAGAVTRAPPAANLNEEEEEEEEKEGSQLVSVSEMSGTTQPTEESRPGSAGPVGASAWRAGGALLSELDSEDVSGSQQGASELSAPGVLEGTESTDDLGDGSLKGAMDMEGASAGSPDFEKVPDIPVIDFDEDEDDSDRVCDMDVGSEKTDEPRRPRHDNDMDEEEEEDEDVEMASEGVTESGLESYGNADEDDFAEDERLDNLNREAPPPPPLLPSAPAAQWDQPNPFADPWAEPFQAQQAVQPAAEPLLGDCVAPPPTAAQAWPDAASFVPEEQGSPQCPSAKAPEKSQSGNLNSESGTPEDDISRDGKLRPPGGQADAEKREKEAEEEEEEPEPETLPADEVLGGPATAPTSAPSSSTTTEDEASDTEGEAQLEDSLVASAVMKMKLDGQPLAQRCLSTVEEGVEEEGAAAAEDTTPPSAASLASYGFDSATTPSNAQSTGESCVRSPGIFSLEELSEEAKEPPAEQQYMECRRQDGDAAEEVSGGGPHPPSSLENPAENVQPLYYSICEKTEDSLADLHPQRRDHAPLSRTYYDVVKLPGAPPKLTCADLPPRSPGGRGASPQLRRLEQHQRQLLELQHRREQQSRPLEEAEQERKRRVEEEERRKKEEAEEEIKRNKKAVEEEEETKQRRELELQLQQQQQELQQRQQIMQWQQELQEASKGQAALLSPSGLCTIYEALESSEEEEEDEELNEEHPESPIGDRTRPDEDKRCSSPSAGSPSPPDSTLSSSNPSREEEMSSLCPPESPEHPSALDLDWGQKVDIVQQLINQTLLLNGDGCSSLLLLPGGAGGTLSPLESSLWPSLLPPLTPPSATVTSVSSFSPDAMGSSAQGEWTVVELETHH